MAGGGLRRDLRRAVWRQNGRLGLAAAAVVLVFVAFLSVYGDPRGTTDSGRLSIDVSWHADGTLGAKIATPYADRAANEAVADKVLPELFGTGAAFEVTYPRDKGGTYSIDARTLDPIAPSDGSLRLSTDGVVGAVSALGLTSADLAVTTPDVPLQIDASTPPDSRFASTIFWDDLDLTTPLEVQVALKPSLNPWLIESVAVVCCALGVLVAMILVGRAAIGGRVSERVGRRWLLVGMGASAAGLVCAIWIARGADNGVLLWNLHSPSGDAVRYAPVLLWLFIGCWGFFGWIATYARDQARQKYPPPPTLAPGMAGS